eukprot:1049644-Prymnesium_polylepis.1
MSSCWCYNSVCAVPAASVALPPLPRPQDPSDAQHPRAECTRVRRQQGSGIVPARPLRPATKECELPQVLSEPHVGLGDGIRFVERVLAICSLRALNCCIQIREEELDHPFHVWVLTHSDS